MEIPKRRKSASVPKACHPLSYKSYSPFSVFFFQSTSPSPCNLCHSATIVGGARRVKNPWQSPKKNIMGYFTKLREESGLCKWDPGERDDSVSSPLPTGVTKSPQRPSSSSANIV
jgi:hypothetical protein